MIVIYILIVQSLSPRLSAQTAFKAVKRRCPFILEASLFHSFAVLYLKLRFRKFVLGFGSARSLSSGLENVRQRRCQESFHKITGRKYFCISQEIILFIINFSFCFDTSKNIVKVMFRVVYENAN